MKYIAQYLILPALLLISANVVCATTLSAQQIEKKKAYFLKFDASGDKSLSETEFIEMTKTQFMNNGKTGWEVEGKKRFARNNLNGDDKVTFEEWLSMQK